MGQERVRKNKHPKKREYPRNNKISYLEDTTPDDGEKTPQKTEIGDSLKTPPESAGTCDSASAVAVGEEDKQDDPDPKPPAAKAVEGTNQDPSAVAPGPPAINSPTVTASGTVPDASGSTVAYSCKGKGNQQTPATTIPQKPSPDQQKVDKKQQIKAVVAAPGGPCRHVLSCRRVGEIPIIQWCHAHHLHLTHVENMDDFVRSLRFRGIWYYGFDDERVKGCSIELNKLNTPGEPDVGKPKWIVPIYENLDPNLLQLLDGVLTHTVKGHKSHANDAMLRELGVYNALENTDSDLIGVCPSVDQSIVSRWSFAPDLSVDDLKAPRHFCCNCTNLLRCKHVRDLTLKGKINLWSVHAAYYYQPEDILAVAIKTGLAQVTHTAIINDYSGSGSRRLTNNSEGHAPYFLTAEGVMQTADEDPDGYSHPYTAAWLRTSVIIKVYDKILLGCCLLFLLLACLLAHWIVSPCCLIVSLYSYWMAPTFYTIRNKCKQVAQGYHLYQVATTFHEGIFTAGETPLPHIPATHVPITFHDEAGVLRYHVVSQEFLNQVMNAATRCTDHSLLVMHILKLNDNVKDEKEKVDINMALALAQRYPPCYAPSLKASHGSWLTYKPVLFKFFVYGYVDAKYNVMQWLGAGNPSLPPALFCEDYTTMARAIDCRVKKPRKYADGYKWMNALHYFHTFLCQVNGSKFMVDTLTAQQFIDDPHHSASNRKMMQQEAGYQSQLMTDGAAIAHKPKYTCFLKWEFMGSYQELWSKAPRVISAPDTFTKIFLGKFTYAASTALKKLIGATKRDKGIPLKLSYAVGANELEVGKWYHDCVTNGYDAGVLEVDFSKWDSTIGPEALAAEHAFYEKLGADVATMHLFRATINVRVTVKIRRFPVASLQLNGGRHTGDPNTSLGNTSLNLAIQQLYLDKVGRDNYRAIAMGDDFIALFNRYGWKAYLEMGGHEAYKSEMIAYGLNPEIVEAASVLTCTFCSRQFWPCYENDKGVVRPTHVLGPIPLKMLTKLGWFWRHVTPADYLSQLVGFAATCNGIPGLRQIVHYEISELQNKYPNLPGIAAVDPDYKISRTHTGDLSISQEGEQLWRSLYLTTSGDTVVEWTLGDKKKVVRSLEHE